jgi:hypothetical protein
MRKWPESFLMLMFVLLMVMQACQKIDVDYGEPDYTNDPNVTYYDNFKSKTATYIVDSFSTSDLQLFTIGYHKDPYIGVTTAASYAELQLPGENPVANASVVFDSLQLILVPKGTFYGDSTQPLTLNVFRLAENIRSKTTTVFYNTSTFALADKIGSKTINLTNKTGSVVSIRLSDAVGQELLDKFVTSSIEVSDSSNFYQYFKGLCISADSTVTNTVASFGSTTEQVLMRLTYHEKGLYATYKNIDFGFTSGRQFSRIQVRTTNTNLSSVIPGISQLLSSTVTGGNSYLHTSLGSYIRINFPTLLTLKEEHPYMRVLKAVMIIKPKNETWAFSYRLPAAVNLYSTDQTNIPIAVFTDNDASNPTLLTGDLVVDQLYGKNTYYSYDITSFINSKIAEGQFSQSALLLTPSSGGFGNGFDRLIIQGENSVQLKLYVLGL